MDIDELHAELTQHRHADTLSVDPAQISAVDAQLPLQEQLRLVGHMVFGKPGKRRNILKHSADESLGSAGADHIAIGTLAQNSADGVDHDGFAGAGLAREHIEAPGELNIHGFNHRDILNVKA